MNQNVDMPYRFPWRFFVMAFGFTWIIWLPGFFVAQGLIELPIPEMVLLGIGSFGPTLSAFYLTRRNQGKEGVKTLIKRALNFRIPIKWLAAIFVLPLAITAAARLVLPQKYRHPVKFELLQDNTPQEFCNSRLSASVAG